MTSQVMQLENFAFVILIIDIRGCGTCGNVQVWACMGGYVQKCAGVCGDACTQVHVCVRARKSAGE